MSELVYYYIIYQQIDLIIKNNSRITYGLHCIELTLLSL